MKTYCLLNHTLTENQINELKTKYSSDEIIYPPKELSDAWAQVAATECMDKTLITKVLDWMKDNKEGDQLIIQGESGHTFVLVDWALSQKITALHAVSQRKETEQVIGETVVKKHIFCHVCFRKYEQFRAIM